MLQAAVLDFHVSFLDVALSFLRKKCVRVFTCSQDIIRALYEQPANMKCADCGAPGKILSATLKKKKMHKLHCSRPVKLYWRSRMFVQDERRSIFFLSPTFPFTDFVVS